MKVERITLIYAVLIVVAIIIIGILAYYYLPPSSWITFSLKYGDTFQSSSVGPSLKGINPARLRWRNCIFTVVYSGKTYTRDVTSILNTATSVYMYYQTATSGIDYDLIRPLNYLSFPITGLSYTSPFAVTKCNADSDCNSGSLKNNICVKNIPIGKVAPTVENCKFYGGATTQSTTISPASDPSISIGVNTSDSTKPAYEFPSTVPSEYATAIKYNTLYCKPNSDEQTFTIDWLQLAGGQCALNGLASTSDSVTLTGSFRVFPYL